MKSYIKWLLYISFFFWKSLKKLKKLELSPLNSRYGVLHLIYSGLNHKMLDCVDCISSFSRWQLIQNSAPFTFAWHKCDIRRDNSHFLAKLGNFLANDCNRRQNTNEHLQDSFLTRETWPLVRLLGYHNLVYIHM